MLGPHYVGEDSQHTVITSLAPTPILRDEEIEEDPEMLEKEQSEVTEEPLNHAMEDGMAIVDEELPQGGVEWLIEESSKEDPDEDIGDVSLQESRCQGYSKLLTSCPTFFAYILSLRFGLVVTPLGLDVFLSFAYV